MSLICLQEQLISQYGNMKGIEYAEILMSETSYTIKKVHN